MAGERGVEDAAAAGPLAGLGLSTKTVHAGEPRPKAAHALATPIVRTATYTLADTQDQRQVSNRPAAPWPPPTHMVTTP